MTDSGHLWPGLKCIILNVALGKKSLDTPSLKVPCSQGRAQKFEKEGGQFSVYTFPLKISVKTKKNKKKQNQVKTK